MMNYFINEVVFKTANQVLDVVFLAGGVIALIAYLFYFFVSNLTKYTKEHKSGELISQTTILILILAVFGIVWALPEIILLIGIWLQKVPLREGLARWSEAAWVYSSIRWIVIALVFFIIAYVLGHEHGKNRWSRSALIVIAIIALGWAVKFWMGILFLSIPMLVAYYAALHDLALILMPASNPEDKTEQRKRFHAFLTYTWGIQSPMTVVDDHAWKKYNPRISGDITWNFSDFPLPLINKLDRPGVVWTRSHQAAAISGGTQFKRIENPGVSFTSKLERLDQVFDLRMQLRSREIEVVSKDGIRFIARYFTAFRIDNQEWEEPIYKQIRLLNPCLRGADKLTYTQGSFPFSHRRVQAALGVTSTKAEEGAPLVPWDCWVMNVIEDQTRKVISQKNLDELWRPANDYKFANALDIIAEEIKKNSEMTLRAVGILLVVARVVNFKFSPNEKEMDEITRQQIASWQSAWTQKRNEILAKAEAKASLSRDEARVYAEGQLIESIVNSLEKAHRKGMSRQVIAMRFLSALQDYTHRHLAGEEEENEETKKRMFQLQNAFKKWQENFFAEG